MDMSSEDRFSIEAGLNNGQKFKEIGEALGKDCTTISKEVRSHLVYKKTGAYGRPFNDCAKRRSCQLSAVCDSCPQPRQNTPVFCRKPARVLLFLTMRRSGWMTSFRRC